LVQKKLRMLAPTFVTLALAFVTLALAFDIRIVPGVPFVPPPAKPSGPDVFINIHPLKGQCFTRTQHPFEYSICPFLNMTQKTVHNDKEKWVLGIWHRWSFDESNNGAYHRMNFENGSDCNGTPRRGEVEIVCGQEEYILQDVSETSTCNYLYKLGIPLPCSGDDGQDWAEHSRNPEYTGLISVAVEVAPGGVHTETALPDAIADEVVAPDPVPGEDVCLGWRTTGGCTADGPRESWQDKECSETITEGKSGYCECRGGERTNEVGCEHESFDCQTACAALLAKVTASDDLLQLHAKLAQLKLQIQGVRQQLDVE
jgi:hypothetical protein